MKILQKIGFYFSLFSAFSAVFLFIIYSKYSEKFLTLDELLASWEYVYADLLQNIQSFQWNGEYIVLSTHVFLSILIFVLTFGVLYSIFYFLTHFKEISQRKLIQKAFTQYVGPGVVKNILARPESLVLGGKSAYLTVYFVDINHFSDLTASYHPKQVVKYLNEYFSEMSENILENDGTIDKYEGDAIMAFWGAPSPQDDHAVLACKTALDHLEKISNLRKKWKKQKKPELTIKIGVTSGEMIVGNIGSKGHFNYTVIGEAVNLAAQLEKLNNYYATKILVSERTYHKAKHDFEFREIGEEHFKGHKEPIRIFELLAEKGKLKAGESELVAKYHEALEAFREKDFELAKKAINHCLRIAAKDKPSKILRERVLKEVK
ncbi:adenylate/guanylate cyclase domain-containing protein [Candidatus Peregrinibacteria bacterium]|jgi:adenylate cyclase|nr:adenylate/guanylate cyclase domain-containing protein [Candidatus Peregrinibacteria bacterium]